MCKTVSITQTCPNCGKEFTIECSNADYNRNKYKKFCSRSCANRRTHSSETKQKMSISVKRFYESHEYPKGFKTVLKNYTCKYCGNTFTKKDKRDTGGVQYCSNACRTKWLKENAKWGGHREGSGRGKSGWYKGIYCASTWELAYVIYCLDNCIDIKRCTDVRTYVYNNKIHKYYPDFIVDGKIIEIKGYTTKQWLAKEEQNKDIVVLYRDDIQKYIDYVCTKYTNVLYELYDGIKPNVDMNKSYYWVHKDNHQTMIRPDKLNEFLSNGWVKGRLRKTI